MTCAWIPTDFQEEEARDLAATALTVSLSLAAALDAAERDEIAGDLVELSERARELAAGMRRGQMQAGSDTIGWCVGCGMNPVDSEQGMDTCHDCTAGA